MRELTAYQAKIAQHDMKATHGDGEYKGTQSLFYVVADRI